MGGVTPLGYAIKDRKLVIVPEEAETVRLIFRRYRELGSVRLLKQDLDEQGIRSKQRTYGNGSRRWAAILARSALCAALEPGLHRRDRAQGRPLPRATRGNCRSRDMGQR